MNTPQSTPTFSAPEAHQHLTPARQPALRIALVSETYPPEINGVAMTLGRMVDGLLRRGHTLQLIRPRQRGQLQPEHIAGLEEVLFKGVTLPNYAGLQFGLPATAQLTRLWRAQPPDLVHVATEGPLGWSALRAAEACGLPLTSSYHTNFAGYSAHYGVGWLQSLIAGYLRNFHNRTQATLVPTHSLASELRQSGYENVTVVSRGVDTQLFQPKRRSSALRKHWGLEHDGTLAVLYVGRLAAEKNLKLVLESFAAIRAVRTDARLIFVGDGPARPSLQAACPAAIFAGMRRDTDLATHYASADLFLFPSLSETFGNVTSEALASGLAVVAYACAAALDLIKDGVNGRHAPPGDAAAFISAAVALACDSARLEKIRAASAPSVAQLNWENIHDELSQVLHAVTSARRSRSARQREYVIVPD